MSQKAMSQRAVIRLLAAAATLATALVTASAQNWRQDGGSRQGGTPGVFDFYVLALSWSPSYCLGPGSRRPSEQCSATRPYDFVVHGLWPQYDRGFPSNCGIQRTPPRAAMEKAADVFPDQGLARHEWAKHGTCSGLSPSDYFDEVAKARAKVVIPAQFHQPKANIDTSPIDIERAFTAANRGLRADMMSVQCTRNMLQEVRICLSKDLRDFVTCPEVNRSSCRTREITLPAAR